MDTAPEENGKKVLTMAEYVTKEQVIDWYRPYGQTDEPIRYFYSTASGFYSAWHESSLEYVMTIGNHRFFKEK